MPVKRLHPERRMKPMRKIKQERWGLGTPGKGRPPVPIEEIRRQGMMLAGRALRQGVRSRPPAQGEQSSSRDQSIEAARPRRGASR
jgi:hypothetical protein